MKRVLAAAVLVLAAPLVSATVLNFDDLTGMAPLTTYGGLTFSGWTYYDFDQSPYNAASGRTRIFGRSNANAFGRATAFTFQGASFAGMSNATVRFDMFYNGDLVASSRVLQVNGTPTFLASGYAGLVNSVTVRSNRPQRFVLDDLSITVPAAIAEPGSIALVIGALAAMVAMGRRRNA